ncbi:hypothetical protein MKY15_22375 [Sporosarcina sp. FSL K6-1540]|uniref:hypothetical protein n=1 Tax=unclassified Sporosarcina TaxID=2647733 RepID=UPI0021036899|nr:hypothetical protein [Sporosarcina sp. resist]
MTAPIVNKTLDSVRDEFKAVFGNGYEYNVGTESVSIKIGGETKNKLIYRYYAGSKSVMVWDLNKINETHKVIKELGFLLKGNEFSSAISKSKTTGNTIDIKGTSIFHAGDNLTIKW